MSNKTKEDNNLIPIRDGRGNFLALGNEVVFTGLSKMSHMVGKVIGFDPGGLSVVETSDNKPKATMAKLRIVFDMTISVPPQSPFVIDMFRIVNPDLEVVLDKMLDSKPQ
jgi:hypothetical protein